MENVKKISINEAPKAFRLFLILLPVIGLFIIKLEIENDFLFLYPTGEYIINNGFPVKDFLSMHTEMNVIIQQWLCDVLFYYLYFLFGKTGLYCYMYICYAIICVLVFKLCKLICDNEFVSAICTFISASVLSYFYISTRPQLISYIVFLTEVIILEKYVKTGKKKLLFILPALSLLLVNFHSSMWLLFFVFALPYAAEALPIKIGKLKQEPCCSFVSLLLCGIVSFALGFVNPYGIKNMMYGLVSFGMPELHVLVSEMQKTSVKSAIGIVFYLLVFICIILIVIKKPKLSNLRFILLFTGTIVLAVTNEKSVAFFIVLGIPSFTCFVNDFNPKIKIKENENKSSSTLLIAVLVVICGCISLLNNTLPTGNLLFPENNQFDKMDKLIDVLDNEKNEIVLFTNIDAGPYFEFSGYHPYIDCRIELFFKSNNGEYDYLTEYIDVCTGKINYRTFADKYNFNYLMVTENDYALLKGIKNDSDFELVCHAKVSDRNGDKYLYRRK